MVKILLLALITMSLATPVHASSAKIYVWRNEKGVLVYSDTPRPGAEEVKTKPGNILKLSTSIETSVLDITPKIIKDDYQVEITAPENNATIRDNTGSVVIRGLIKPLFKSGYNVQLYLDDKPHKKPQSYSRFALRNIDRGEHEIVIELLNKEGKVIASSKPTIFYMHRSSVK